MKRLAAGVYCALTISTVHCSALAAVPKQAIEHFNHDTGELYWDLNNEVRLRYIPSCLSARDYSDTLYELILKIDLLSIYDHLEAPYTVTCSKKGLRVNYRLREDELFPQNYRKAITINEEALSYHSHNYGMIKHMADSENYQRIYSAMQTRSPVVAKVYGESFFSTQAKPEVQLIINTSNLDNAEEASATTAQTENNRLNDQIHKKYWLAILINSALLSCFLAGGFLVLRRSLRSLKNAYREHTTGESQIKLIIFRLLNKINREKAIIKTDGLKPYSVASELLKWTKLRESGVVSEEEFQEAREKILKR
ncbi:MAG: hypothetical protein V7772_06085 [Pseudomonas profundi]|uniref:hypothetical protein n=1 Tax=Pseudomonas profundi TaxID=1981513 RepID=UPI0030029225